MTEKIYVYQLGICHICGVIDEDLRFGVCVDCAEHVVAQGAFAWDVHNPDDRWLIER